MSAINNIFKDYAPRYYEMGISVIPTGGDNGKKPKENGFMKYAEKLPYNKTIDRWCDSYPDANIGIMTGPVSNLTVVDVDDPNLVSGAMQEFGETPVVDHSPRGGAHFYYRYNGERSLNRLGGRGIDVRGGLGGVPLLIAPPSIHHKTGKSYTFVQGGMYDLQNLPFAKEGSLPMFEGHSPNGGNVLRNEAGLVLEGNRTNILFRELREICAQCETIDELEFKAHGINESICEPPFSDNEVNEQVRGVWKLRIEGRLFKSGDRYAQISIEEAQPLLHYAMAYVLYSYLKIHHPKSHIFAVSADGLAKVFNCSPNTVRKARDFIHEIDYLELVEEGKRGRDEKGQFKMTPNIYRFPPVLKY
jgi:hypothetical protein